MIRVLKYLDHIVIYVNICDLIQNSSMTCFNATFECLGKGSVTFLVNASLEWSKITVY